MGAGRERAVDCSSIFGCERGSAAPEAVERERRRAEANMDEALGRFYERVSTSTRRVLAFAGREKAEAGVFPAFTPGAKWGTTAAQPL